MFKQSESIALELLAGLVSTGGATVSPVVNGEQPTSGFMVGNPEAPALSLAHDAVTPWRVVTWIDQAVSYVRDGHEACLGAWRDEDGTVYFDVSETFTSEDEATSAARTRKELAIWDVSGKREVRV